MISKGQVYSNGIGLQFGHNLREVLGSPGVVGGEELASQGTFRRVFMSVSQRTHAAPLYTAEGPIRLRISRRYGCVFGSGLLHG